MFGLASFIAEQRTKEIGVRKVLGAGVVKVQAELSWWIFAVAGLGLLLITLATVSYQSLKAAMTNPVRSLRSE